MKKINKQNLLYLCCFIPFVGLFIIVLNDKLPYKIYRLSINICYNIYQILSNIVITTCLCSKFFN